MLGVTQKTARDVQVAATAQPEPDDIRNEDKTHKFFTSHKYPFYYLSITKCGSTFLKNLLYQIDHDQLHPDPKRIHDYPQDLLRAHETPRWMIRRSRFVFTVLRDPVERFLSMYFDKIYGEGPQNFPELREEIALEAGLDLRRNLDAKRHEANCLALLDWLEKNLAHETDLPVNPHWRRQMARVSTLSSYRLGFFTLEGLNWQMPMHFADMIPDLAQRMETVRNRNKTHYPVDKLAVATDALRARVAQLYPDDTEQHARVSRQWAKKKERGAPTLILDNSPKIHVLGSHRHNANAIVTAKGGCSFVRNLFYTLDHGRPYQNPQAINKHGVLLQGQKSARELADGINFMVLRHPLERFYSLYFDKVWGKSDNSFGWIGEALARNRRFRVERDLTAEEHHDNCCRLLGFLESRFNDEKPEDQNAHWRPQYVRAEQAADFGFHGVQLDQLQPQLIALAAGKIRGLDAAFDLTKYRNESDKPISPDAITSTWIIDRVETLYAEDIALYERLSIGWGAGSSPPRL